MSELSLSQEEVPLPSGAWAAAERKMIHLAGRPMLGFTQGRFRTYLYPVFTPKGFAVTGESPSDHPHHQSIWVAADHVNLHVPAAGGVEVYSYNFYVNEVFQGRAPGRIEERSFDADIQAHTAVVQQSMRWRGPNEWGAQEGREVLHEHRTTRFTVKPDDSLIVIDIRSQLSAPGHPVSIGPTRHAWFNARLGPGMGQQYGATLRQGPVPEGQLGPSWHACTASVGGGHQATVVMAPDSSRQSYEWYVSPWGVMTANPCRRSVIDIHPHAPPVELSARLLIMDGAPSDDQIEAWLSN